jgi:hypothetical protein
MKKPKETRHHSRKAKPRSLALSPACLEAFALYKAQIKEADDSEAFITLLENSQVERPLRKNSKASLLASKSRQGGDPGAAGQNSRAPIWSTQGRSWLSHGFLLLPDPHQAFEPSSC